MVRRILFSTIALAVTLTFVALVYDVGSQRRSKTFGPTLEESTQTAEAPSNAEVDEPAAVVPPRALGDDQNRTVTEGPADAGAEINARRRTSADENNVRELVRRQATKDMQEAYSLMLEHVGLAQQEKEALLALLIEIQMAATWTSYQSGTTMPEQERSDRIAAIIGDTKLQQFLALERNRSAYWEVAKVGSLLRRKGVPLTDTQRAGLLKVVVDVRDLYTMPSSDLDRYSIAYVEHSVTQIDEYDRHVVELLPSVLSPTQGVYLFEQYQKMAYDRTDALERQKKQYAVNPTDKPNWYFPGRWPD